MRPLLKLSAVEDQAETARLRAFSSLAHVSVPANDDRDQGAELNLDRELADLPCEFPDVPAPTVTDLDGNPVQVDGLTLWDLRAARRAAFVHPAAGDDDSDVIDLDIPARPTSRRVAKNPNRKGSKPRTSFERDKRIIRRKQALSEVGPDIIAANDPVPLVGEPLTYSSPSQKLHVHGVMGVTDDEKVQVKKLSPSTPKGMSKSTEKRRRADENDTRKAPAWDRTTDIIKGAFSFENVSTRGAGIAWTLNLGNDVIQAANDNPGAFKEWMHDRLTKAVEKFVGKRDLVWVPEFTPGGRLHLHGVVDATDDEKVQVEVALRRAGGKWAHKDGEEHQALAKVMWGASGWARYSLKAASKARSFFGCKSVLSATQGVRRRARAAYEADRAALAARQRPIAVEVPQTTPEAAAPVGESLDASAPASMSRSRSATGPTTPLPIPAVAIQVPSIVLDGTWKASIKKVSLPTTFRSSWPMPTRAPRPVLAVQISRIATRERFNQIPADARSRGPPTRSCVAPDLHGRDQQDRGQGRQQDHARHQPEELTAEKRPDDRAGRHGQQERPVPAENREALIPAVAREPHQHRR